MFFIAVQVKKLKKGVKDFMKKYCKKFLSCILVTALVFSLSGVNVLSTEAAAKPSVKLNKTSVSVQAGKKVTLKVIQKNIAGIKKTTWSSKDKKIATVTSKGIVKGVKKGSTVVNAKVKYRPGKAKKFTTKTLKCKVTVKGKPYADTETPAPTEEPAVYGKGGEVSVYDKDKSNHYLSIDASDKVHDISDMLYGIFIEDINFAADGGLYAEMVQNRSFEFTKLASGNEKHAWKDVGKVMAEVVKNDKTGCLNANNPNYMVIKNASSSDAGIANTGFLDGMSVNEGASYKFSVYAKGTDGYTGGINVDIINGNTDAPAASGKIDSVTAEWKKYELTLKSSVTAYTNISLQITIPKGQVAVDMVSLFPEDTYKGRENGLRKDLAQKLEELSPAFLRFPGGCVIEGASLDFAYDWKDSIGTGADGEPLKFNNTYGDVAARKQGQDIWTNEHTTSDPYPSFMSYGLGFYEYFLLAEDIGATGVPVLNCGMCCMGQADGSGPAVGTPEFEKYVQDALDLVEFCRGDSSTKWGAVRTAMGHEKPFNLKYIGIGNEQWGNNFYKHYEAFASAFDEARKNNPGMYGDIELMFSAGLDDGDSGTHYMDAYKEAAAWLKDNPGRTINDFAGAIDHHYYNDPSWFLEHADYYDEKNYSRDSASMTDTKFGGGINVFLGEYAARSNRLEAALAEAAYMTGLERNGDIVKMAAYAPLFGNLTALHWAPDLIWFNNHTSTCSINYYMQKLFASNAGTTLLKSTLEGADIPEEPFKGKTGVGTWSTSAKFDNVKIVDNQTGEVLAQDDFTEDDFEEKWYKVSDGKWKVQDGKLVQSSTNTNTNLYASTGSTVYFGSRDWENYTYTVDAVKTGGVEGFLIPFSVQDGKNNYFWNIGGWNNTVSCLQKVTDGNKSDQVSGTVKNINIKNGTKYSLKVVVTDNNVKCYINNELYIDYDLPDTANAESYQVVSTDSTGDIIVKLVNVTGYPKTFAIDIAGAENISDTASAEVVAGKSLSDDNILGQTEAVTLKSSVIKGISKQFNYTVPEYSASVIRIKTSQ